MPNGATRTRAKHRPAKACLRRCDLSGEVVMWCGQRCQSLSRGACRVADIWPERTYLSVAAGCVRSHFPWAYNHRLGAVPGRDRGLEHTAPTYFCRDSAGNTILRRPPRRFCASHPFASPDLITSTVDTCRRPSLPLETHRARLRTRNRRNQRRATNPNSVRQTASLCAQQCVWRTKIAGLTIRPNSSSNTATCHAQPGVASGLPRNVIDGTRP